jgi:uncharacterized protein (TIGR00299 family) protein
VARAIYFDCFSGASGDMLLGALLDAGLSLPDLRSGLAFLPIEGWGLDADSVEQRGIHGTRARVVLEQPDQPHRGLGEVLRILQSASLPPPVLERSAAVFTRLAEVEAEIHGTSTEEVEFHEVGAIDAIVDITGVVLGLHLLGVDWQHISCSALPTGSGWARSAHGPLPVPAPATLELLRRASAPLRTTPPTPTPPGELLTPTGAALLTELARFDQPPLKRVDNVGYGFGTRELPWPNAVRVWLGEASLVTHDLERDQVAQLETNLDDTTPEELGFAMERLLEAGALDVAFSPLQMKKNRPGVLLRVLARPQDALRMAELLLEHTTALGTRVQTIERLIARRSQRTVSTPWGDVRVKLKLLGERAIAAPEYEDCARLARDAGVPLAEVYAAARTAANSETP